MKTGPFSFPDFAEFLRDLAKQSEEQFLVGGQAVNFWAEVFDQCGDRQELPALRPFTSKDCDVWVGSSLWHQLKTTKLSACQRTMKSLHLDTNTLTPWARLKNSKSEALQRHFETDQP